MFCCWSAENSGNELLMAPKRALLIDRLFFKSHLSALKASKTFQLAYFQSSPSHRVKHLYGCLATSWPPFHLQRKSSLTRAPFQRKRLTPSKRQEPKRKSELQLCQTKKCLNARSKSGSNQWSVNLICSLWLKPNFLNLTKQRIALFREFGGVSLDPKEKVSVLNRVSPQRFRISGYPGLDSSL